MNDVKLQEGHPVDENLRPLKVGGKSTAIETAQHGDGCRINGDLVLDPVSQKTIINATDKLYFDGGTHTYIDEESTDRMRFTVGTDEMLILDEASDAVTMAATNWIAGTVSGATITEFSAANSAYAGMILGYTRLEGDLTNQNSYEIQDAMTVEDDTHKITFITPPSEYVEIELTCFIDIGTTDTAIAVGLSSASATSGYSVLSGELEYDISMFSDDELDDDMFVVKFICKASHLASIGSSNTFYIGFSTNGSTKTAYLRYGYRASHGNGYHPMVIKATALPATIYDGT